MQCVGKSIITRAVHLQRRHAGGFLNKNIRVEENSGIRESSYKTWKFDGKSTTILIFGCFLPSYLLYNMMIDENVKKDKQVGREQTYGVVFSRD